MTEPGFFCAACLLVLLTLCSACARDVEVTLKERVPLEIDLSKVAKQALRGITLSKNGQLPDGFSMKVPFLLTHAFDFRKNDKFAQYKDVLVGVGLKQVSYAVLENTMNRDLPGPDNNLEVLIERRDDKTANDEFQKIGYFFPIPANKFGVFDRLHFGEGGREIANQALQSLSFQIALSGLLVVDALQSRAVPSGRLSLEVTVEVSLYANVF